MLFWERFVALCEANRTTPTTVVKELGIAPSGVTKWKNGCVPRDTTLLKISRHFDVSVGYLKGEEETPVEERLSEQAAELVSIFEQLSVVGKARLLVFAEEIRKGEEAL